VQPFATALLLAPPAATPPGRIVFQVVPMFGISCHRGVKYFELEN